MTPTFERELRRLTKRYKSLPDDILRLVALLENNPNTGSSLGRGLYKIRLGIKSKGHGKRGGARVISYYIAHGYVFLLSIYDKSELGSVSSSELDALILEAKQIRTRLP